MISVLLPTRGRPDKLKRSVQSLLDTCSSTEAIEIIVGIDEDDEPTKSLSFDYPVRASVEPREDTLGQKIDRLFKLAKGDIFIFWTDDMWMETQGWDSIARSAEKLFPDGIMFGYMDEPMHVGFASNPIVNRKFTELAGYMPTVFPFWWIDTWLDEIAEMIGRKVMIPIRPRSQDEENQGRGKTRGLRDLVFWQTLFDSLRPVRVELAEHILKTYDQANPWLAVQCRQKRPHLIQYFMARGERLRNPETAQVYELAMSFDAPADERYLRAKRVAEEILAQLTAPNA